jgi:competence protein ComEC
MRQWLCMGDAETEAETHILKTIGPLSADIIKAGHHGSKTSSSRAFLEAVHPQHAIISVARNNRFNHPSPITLNTFRDMGIQLHRTDHQGAVIFMSDGKTLQKADWKHQLLAGRF